MRHIVHILSAPAVHVAVLAAAAFTLFSNTYRHEYHLDDGHLLLENTAVRSLKNIPSYFHDPSTLTALRANIDYRPVLQVTYALNYALSGYHTWSWHLVQTLLHALCAAVLYAFCLRLMLQSGYAQTAARWTAFFAAVIFTVHPAASGVVNYLSARSSLLTAAFLLPSLFLYMQPYDHPRYVKPRYGSAILFCLALFTKVEAVGALPVFFLYDMLQTARRRMADSRSGGPLKDAIQTMVPSTLVRFWPHLLVAAVYFLIRLKVMAGYDTGARHGAEVTPLVYFFTQTTAWWHYVRIWFAPVNLIADNMTYPVFRSLFNPQVLLAAGGWLLVAAAVRMAYARHPHLLFLTISALCLIAPTSSFAPLAEMVNEHRPYLPVAILSCAWLIPLLPAAFRLAEKSRISAAMAVSAGTLLIVSLSYLTWQRNLVFRSARSYYEDILKKSPSARAYANYGLTFLQEARFSEALANYEQALRLAPNWHIVHINLGLIYTALGNDSLAQFCYDRAVATDHYSATAKIYRGEYLLSRRRYSDALRDFEDVLPLHRQKYAICKGAATAAAGLGAWEKAVLYAKGCCAENPVQCEFDIVGMSRPYWDRTDLCRPGIRFFAALDSVLPNRWWVHQNIAALAGRCSDTGLARIESLRAQTLKKAADTVKTR
jgi:tetratricopeptide (TPR) repeat protein